jgi:hypothetical protein
MTGWSISNITRRLTNNWLYKYLNSNLRLLLGYGSPLPDITNFFDIVYICRYLEQTENVDQTLGQYLHILMGLCI